MLHCFLLEVFHRALVIIYFIFNLFNVDKLTDIFNIWR